MDNIKIASVIVTYNRKDLLKKCLEANINQSYKLADIIVVNNASTDGTELLLEQFKNDNKDSNITIYNLGSNLGGAGGFNEGIKCAIKKNYDYYWIMDDDTIPNRDCLEKMVEKIHLVENNLGFLCSNVRFSDGNACIMNTPSVEPIWNHNADKGLIELKSASFVSILIRGTVIKEIGLPIKEFFIWGDDTEYTERITKNFKGYMVIDSIAHHLMKDNKPVNIIEDNPERIERYFYEYRNKFFISKKYGFGAVLRYFKFVLRCSYNVITKSKSYKLKRLKSIYKGFFAGITFNPKIESC